MIKIFFSLLILAGGPVFAAWPDGPWLNGKPTVNAIGYAVAFGSPLDFQFLKIMDVWKNLEKKYKPLGMDFIVIAKQESILPFSETIITHSLLDRGFHLPVFMDFGSNYSNKWRAYVSPTVNIVLKNDKVISFDPGNFDPFTFEKSIQKVLKENGLQHLPARDYNNESEYKNCTSSLTYFMGRTQRFAWGRDPVELDKNWDLKPDWIEKNQTNEASIVIKVKQSAVAVIAEATGGSPAVLKITSEDQKPTSVSVKSLKVYELLSGQDASKETKITIEATGKNLKLWALQTLPQCRYYK